MRTNRKFDDIQTLIYTLIGHLIATETPWSSWGVVRSYPEEEYFIKNTKAFLYVDHPFLEGQTFQQGGRSIGTFSVIIGMWGHRDYGGAEEVSIMASELLELVDDTNRMHTEEFDVSIGSTDYTNTTLKAQGLRVKGITGPRQLHDGEDLKDFRQEMTLTVLF